MGLSDSWCCCVGLRTGTLAVGVIHLVASIAAFLTYCLVWIQIAAAEEAKNEKYIHDRNVRLFYILLGIGFTCFISIAVNSLLIHGVRKHQRMLLLPWLIWYALLQTVALFGWIGVTVWLLVTNSSGPAPVRDGAEYAVMIAITILAGLVVFPVVWCWYVSVTFYYRRFGPSDGAP